MSFIRITIFTVSLLIISTLYSFSQKYISDSLIVKFGVFSNHTILLKVDSVIDNRLNLKNSQVRISERKRYMYIPVDFYYVTEHPLHSEIKSLFPDSFKNDTIYKLVIKRFEINYRDGFKTIPVLIAHIEVYASASGGRKQFLGTLIYETEGEKPKKNMEKEAFEILIEKWKNDFSSDMHKIKPHALDQQDKDFHNLIPPLIIPEQSIFSVTAFVLGYKNFMVDGDLGFFEPEATQKFFRSTSFIRYRNEERFESIAFGSRSYLYYYRINDRFVVNIEQKICIGVNRWKDMDVYDHKLYDIVHLDVGIRAGLYYYPFGKRTIVAGLITTHDLYYIYCMDGFYRPGFGLVVGVNF